MSNAFIKKKKKKKTLANVEREKRYYKCCEPNVLEATDIQSENLCIMQKNEM